MGLLNLVLKLKLIKSAQYLTAFNQNNRNITNARRIRENTSAGIALDF